MKVGRKKEYKGKTKSFLLKLTLSDYKKVNAERKKQGFKSLTKYIQSKIIL